MSRYFDTDLSTAEQKAVLKTAISYAKADIAAQSLPDDLVEYAEGFGELYFLTTDDFSLLSAIEISGVTAFVGPRPTHRPRYW